MRQLKKLSKDAVAGALAKVERYRLLNESWEAESICRDVLEVDPQNREARVSLLLALSDQFGDESAARLEEALQLVEALPAEYDRAYYAGILHERKGKAIFERGTPGSGEVAYEWFVKAMDWYEKAEAVQPPGNQSATLRWNTCLRMMKEHASIRPDDSERQETMLE